MSHERNSAAGSAVLHSAVGIVLILAGCFDSAAAVSMCPAPADAVCSASALESALSTASPGDTVVVGGCVIEGSFAVPAGVRLQGVAPDCSRIRGGTGPTVLSLLPGASLDSMTIELPESAACVATGSCTAAVLCSGTGDGTVELSDLVVLTARAPAILADRPGSVRIASVSTIGTAGPSATDEPDSKMAPTHGLVLNHVPSAEVADFASRGFDGAGVLSLNSTAALRRCTLENNYGGGLIAHASQMTYEDISVSDTAPRLAGLIRGGSGISSVGSNVSLNGATVTRNYGGIYHIGTGEPSTAHYANIRADSNAGLGLLIAWASDVRVTDVSLDEQTMTEQLGDGLQLVGSPASLVLTRVGARGNARVGVVIDFRGLPVGSISLDDVVVETTGDALGFIVQNGTLPPGIDAEVTRLGTADANDSVFTGTLETTQ